MSYATNSLYPSNINAKILQSENILNSDTITTKSLVVTEPLEIDDLTLKTLVVEQSAVIGTIEEDNSVYSAPLIIGADLYNSSSLFCYGNIETQSKLTSGVLDTSQLNIGAYDEATTSFVSNASLDSGGNLTNTSIISTGSITGDTLQGNSGISATLLSIGSIDTDTSVITSNMSIDSTGYLRTEGMLKSTAQIGFQSGFVGDDSSWTTKVEMGYNSSSQGYVNADLFSGDLTGSVTGDLTGSVTGDLTGSVTGDLTGSVTGDLTGSVTGDLTGGALSTALTQASSDSSTLLATTEFVSNAIAATYVPTLFSGRATIVDNQLSSGWAQIFFDNGGFASTVSSDSISVVATAILSTGEDNWNLTSFVIDNITNTSFEILGTWIDSRENQEGGGYYQFGFSYIATSS
jgi:hypothetical protein